MKRIRPAPMGRAFRYQRRLCHIIVTVAEKGRVSEAKDAAEPKVVKAAGKKTAAKKAPAKKTAAKKAAAKKKAAKA
jgi:large subunit ribosomal protein L22